MSSTENNSGGRVARLVFEAAVAKRSLKTGYTRLPGGISPAESDTVAGHSHAVSLLALAIAADIGDIARTVCGREIDIAELATMAIFHDVGETRSGDTGAQSHALYGVCRLYSLERDGLRKALEDQTLCMQVLRLFDDYRAYRTPEAIVVHAADLLEGFEKGLSISASRPWLLDAALRLAKENITVLRNRPQNDETDVGLFALKIVDTVVAPSVAVLLGSYGLESRIADFRA